MKKLLLLSIPALVLSASAFAEGNYHNGKYDQATNDSSVVTISQYSNEPKSRTQVYNEMIDYQHQGKWNKKLYQGA